MLTEQQRKARARLAAHRRWHPDQPAPDPEAAAREQSANDALIEEILRRAPIMTPAQCVEVARLVGFGPPAEKAQ